jgi:hypothetical protein
VTHTRDRLPLVYILAASHSGSTLLAMLLGSHPDVCTVGELKATSLGPLDAYRCSCGVPIQACPFWQAVTAAMRARGVAFDLSHPGTDLRTGASPYARRLLKPLHRSPPLELVRDTALHLDPRWRRHLARVNAVNAALVGALREHTGARVIVDSSKIGLRLKYLLRDPAFDMRVIRLIRDGRAVALTYMDPERFADARDPRLRGGGTGLARDAERLPMERAAREWRRSNEEGDAIVARLDRSRWIEARYEAVCANPRVGLARLFEFLGVAPEAAPAHFRAHEHHVIGNGMRLDTTSEIRLDDRWQATLTAEELHIFDDVAGGLNRGYGYAPAAGALA